MKKNYFNLLLLFATLGIKASAQCTGAPGCTTTISSADASNHTILSGQKYCITSSGSVSGLITISPGGILCNEGAVNSTNLWVAGGTFNNYGSINTSALMVSQGGDFLNEGTAAIDSLLVTETSSTFINNGTLTNQRFTTAASAVTTNNGNITSDFLYDSVGVFNNNANVTVNFDIGNAYSSSFINGASGYVKINRDFYNSTSATFNVGKCMITIGRDWYNSAIIAGPATGNCGGFNIAGASLSSGTIGTASTHVDMCDAGHPVTGIDGNSGTIATTTTYCSCVNNCVMVGINEQVQTSNVLISTIYPNPANSNITILLNDKEPETLSIQVVDMTGKLIISNNIKTTIGENRTELNVSSLASGTYILNITDSKQLQSKRLFNVSK